MSIFVLYCFQTLVLILIIFLTFPFLHMFLSMLLPLNHLLVKGLPIWKLKIILLDEKKEIEQGKYFTSLQNSQIFIFPIVLASFPMALFVLTLRERIFMTTERRGEHGHWVVSCA